MLSRCMDFGPPDTWALFLLQSELHCRHLRTADKALLGWFPTPIGTRAVPRAGNSLKGLFYVIKIDMV